MDDQKDLSRAIFIIVIVGFAVIISFFMWATKVESGTLHGTQEAIIQPTATLAPTDSGTSQQDATSFLWRAADWPATP